MADGGVALAGAALAGPATAQPHLDVVGLSKAYRGQRVLEGLDFAVAKGELASLLGPSGCGKTTLLRLIAGLVDAEAGRIGLGGRDVTRVPAHRRNVSVVFQNYALFPHLDVAENIAFGLKARGAPRAQIAAAVSEALALVRMEAFAHRPVSALSGGQQQRVAVARALAVKPDLLLLDEPFSALDRKLREAMQVELKALLRARGMTAIFVTHDQEEALAVSNRIAVMNAGRIEQFADPATLYAKPATPFALEFVGLSTRLSGTVTEQDGEAVGIETRHGRVTAFGQFTTGTRVIVGVRPERVSFGPGAEGENAITLPLSDIMPLGSKTHLHGATEGDDRVLCEVPGSADLAGLHEGKPIRLVWSRADTLIYPAP